MHTFSEKFTTFERNNIQNLRTFGWKILLAEDKKKRTRERKRDCNPYKFIDLDRSKWCRRLCEKLLQNLKISPNLQARLHSSLINITTHYYARPPFRISRRRYRESN